MLWYCTVDYFVHSVAFSTVMENGNRFFIIIFFLFTLLINQNIFQKGKRKIIALNRNLVQFSHISEFKWCVRHYREETIKSSILGSGCHFGGLCWFHSLIFNLFFVVWDLYFHCFKYVFNHHLAFRWTQTDHVLTDDKMKLNATNESKTWQDD